MRLSRSSSHNKSETTAHTPCTSLWVPQWRITSFGCKHRAPTLSGSYPWSRQTSKTYVSHPCASVTTMSVTYRSKHCVGSRGMASRLSIRSPYSPAGIGPVERVFGLLHRALNQKLSMFPSKDPLKCSLITMKTALDGVLQELTPEQMLNVYRANHEFLHHYLT